MLHHNVPEKEPLEFDWRQHYHGMPQHEEISNLLKAIMKTYDRVIIYPHAANRNPLGLLEYVQSLPKIISYGMQIDPEQRCREGSFVVINPELSFHTGVADFIASTMLIGESYLQHKRTCIEDKALSAVINHPSPGDIIRKGDVVEIVDDFKSGGKYHEKGEVFRFGYIAKFIDTDTRFQMDPNRIAVDDRVEIIPEDAEGWDRPRCWTEAYNIRKVPSTFEPIPEEEVLAKYEPIRELVESVIKPGIEERIEHHRLHESAGAMLPVRDEFWYMSLTTTRSYM